MLHYVIYPIEPAAGIVVSAEVDAHQVLHKVQTFGWTKADVDRDGEYICSIARNEHGVWTVFHRNVGMRDRT